MELSVAEAIYATKYATAVRYNDLPAGIDVTMMDYAVNSGTGRPIRSARAILGIPGNAIMDQALLNALKKADPQKFINAMDDERLHFMHGIRKGSAWATFGGGWSKRVADLRAYAEHLIAAPGTVPEPTAPDLSNVSTPKAKHVAPSKGKVATGTIGGATAGGSTHFAGVPIELALVLAGFVAVGGVGYYLYKKQEAAIANATVIIPQAAQVSP
jgi:lysozyme family protein